MTGTAAKRRKLSKQFADDDQVSTMPDLAAVIHIQTLSLLPTMATQQNFLHSNS